MKYPTIRFAVSLHHRALSLPADRKTYNETQLGYLAAALEHIQNDVYYPTFPDKLAHLLFACIKFHPFFDGNKRTAICLALAFIILNEPALPIDDFCERMEDVVVAVAANLLSEEALKDRLRGILFPPPAGAR